MNIANSNQNIVPVYLGKINDWQDIVIDLAKMQHLLIVGLSGSGKSTLIHNIMMNMMYHTDPYELQVLLIDPMGIEFNVYNGLPYLLIPVVSDKQKINAAIHWIYAELKDRQDKFRESNVRNFKD